MIASVAIERSATKNNGERLRRERYRNSLIMILPFRFVLIAYVAVWPVNDDKPVFAKERARTALRLFVSIPLGLESSAPG